MSWTVCLPIFSQEQKCFENEQAKELLRYAEKGMACDSLLMNREEVIVVLKTENDQLYKVSRLKSVVIWVLVGLLGVFVVV